MLNTSFRFTLKDSDDYTVYSCQRACGISGYYLVSWVYEDRTSAVEYPTYQVTEYVDKGDWVIVGETNA